ncbi:MAG: ATP-binding cassette domain-containing protein [Alphaproteobacteria bacterium]
MAEHDASVLTLRRLVHRFGKRVVLDIDRWSAAKGRHCLIEGPSGSGKSTLLHLIAGLLRPDSGEIILEDQPLGALSGRALDRLRSQRIGIILQNFHLIEALDVRANLRLAQSLSGSQPEPEVIDALLAQLGLSGLAQNKPAALSQGERQRVAIIRAVLNRPTLLLADEPTSALDDRHAEAVLKLLIDQADAAGATLLMATHDSRAKAHLPVGLKLGDPSLRERPTC